MRTNEIIGMISTIALELDARNCVNNCINDEFAGKSWDELCEMGIDLFSQLNKLNYGMVAKYKTCSVHFACDDWGNDLFLIKDNDGNVIGKFVEEYIDE